MTIDNIYNPRLVRIQLQTSKTDPFNHHPPMYRGRLMPSGSTFVMAHIQREILRPTISATVRSTLTRARLVTKIRKALSHLGLEAKHFSGHSFRKGIATTAAAQGISDSHIKKDLGPLEELRISTLSTTLRWSCRMSLT